MKGLMAAQPERRPSAEDFIEQIKMIPDTEVEGLHPAVEDKDLMISYLRQQLAERELEIIELKKSLDIATKHEKPRK